MPTRTSKIARLPKTIRDQLGQHLEDGRRGIDLVQWLNSLPDVQKITADHFNNSPISEQNLSDWKSSGHVEWLRRQAAQEAALSLLTAGEDLGLGSNEEGGLRCGRLLDNFAAILAVEMSRLALLLLEQETDPVKKWNRVCEINRELSKLRRDHDRAARIALAQERQNREAERQKQEDERRMQAEDKKRLDCMLRDSDNKDHLARSRFRNDPEAEAKAELFQRLKYDLPVDGLLDPAWRQAGTILFRPTAAKTKPQTGQ
jgi:hypothetical protein